MRRAILLLACLAALTGCGDLSGPFGEAARTVRAAVEQRRAVAPPPLVLTRAQIAADPAASLRVTDRLGRAAILQAVAALDGQATFRSGDGVNLAFRGPVVVRSRGLTDDIAGLGTDPAVPLMEAVALRPGATAPGATHRREVRRVTPLSDIETQVFVCSFVHAGPDPQEIVELRFDTVRIEESCAEIGDETAEAFVNTWWIVPETGQVWRSRQWISRAQGYLDIEVLKPLG
ncbi:YjbF family lipoprotein [Roseobacter sp. HKCCA0434]|uniref:YjbF family lipoprotein n=1 Tax=Roseobacter sp. HKCCA0434 TaxID=3079297 RepID=UPI0029059876|nr:YjbF family lipoprotein [Roseobacter sp. HKCCA0434]